MTMRIQDRKSNRIIADVHPLLADEVARLAEGDKLRVQFVSPHAVIVWNTPNTVWNMAARSAAA